VSNRWSVSLCGIFFFVLPPAYAGQASEELAQAPFPAAQAELERVIQGLAEDNMSRDIERIQALHLDSEKFSKFGPRSFERQDVDSANESEAAFFGSLEAVDYQVKDLKIDVFGDVAVVTYYPQVAFIRDGEQTRASGRQTLVFLHTEAGWKIVHEHGTPSW
jgi:ketosteroid isomerase-like protein